MPFAEEIKAERERRGLTQTEFARLLQSTQGTICAYENGGRPKQPELMWRLLRELQRQELAHFVKGGCSGSYNDRR